MLKLPTIRGVIERRILANYHIDPDVMQSNLPPPFRPKLVNGYGLAGICLIRLKSIRPRFFPFPWGLGSENAAHRFAVEWDAQGRRHEGVFVPRRDTNSWLNVLAGGSIFPGVHHRAAFVVSESNEQFSVSLKSIDGQTSLSVAGSVSESEHLSDTSVFPSISAASDFFQTGSLGYSATNTPGRYDGLELCCSQWKVESMKIDKIQSSFFEDQSRFPRGSVAFDCALLMRDIKHEWRGREDLCC